jgi:hypothetical protein
MVAERCLRIDPKGYGCWLIDGHDGDCEPDAGKLGAVSGNGPSCRYCGQPLIRWPSDTWADTGDSQVCPVPGQPGRFRGHKPHEEAD